jgi:hypothetical protein
MDCVTLNKKEPPAGSSPAMRLWSIEGGLIRQHVHSFTESALNIDKDHPLSTILNVFPSSLSAAKSRPGMAGPWVLVDPRFPHPDRYYSKA